MMIVSYLLSPHDNNSNMLGNETFQPPRSAGFHNWRFGKNGTPHPATCPTCGRKSDPDYVDSKYKAKRRSWDVGCTYDGYVIVSKRFREFCTQQGWDGMTFVSLPADSDFFILRLSKVLPFDAQRRGTRFEKMCATCNSYYCVVGATPVFLSGVTKPIEEGFFRTDLEFAAGPEQSPLIIVGVKTAEKLRQQQFHKFHLQAVES